MKKLILLGVILVIGAGITVASMIEKPIMTGCTTSTWTAVTLPTSQECTGFVIKAEDATKAFKVSDTSTGTKYITVPAGSSLTYTLPKLTPPAATLCYVQYVTADDGSIQTLPSRD